MTCFAQPEQIGLSINGHSDVLDFAREELNLFLGKAYKLSGNSNPDWQLVLETDSKLTEGSFNIQHLKNGKQNQIILRGSNDAAVLHAVYTFLEKAGVRFEITGAFIPVKVDITQLTGYSETIHPKVKKRGIRQHINFPMDISSYPLNEAKEYIRNLARLRFNFITFHSYPGHWYVEC
ncbi:hypothetical protein AGMMS50239_41240 [Bacteroidia bacterium]|nr:hypothetical protein AGMMS50239_41240 [Bacteroidia bacterium]